MPVEVACPSCGQRFSVDDKYAGRRAKCGVCNAVVQIPGPEPAGSGAPRTLGQAVERLDLREWETEYLRVLVALGADEPRLVAALNESRRPGVVSDRSLPEFLVAKGVIEEGLSHRAKLALKPRDDVASKATARVERVGCECPNCFQAIQPAWKSCPYCGERLKDEPELLTQCPNCKTDQPQGSRFCFECGAHLEPGMYEELAGKRCPRCGLVSFGKGTTCLRCGTAFNAPAPRVSPRELGPQLMATLKQLRTPLLGALVVVGVILGWGHIRGLASQGPKGAVSSLIHGQSEAALRSRVEEWNEALQYGDYERLATMFEPDLNATAAQVPALIPAIAGFDPSRSRISEMSTERIESSGTTGTVYVKLSIRDIDPGSRPGGGAPIVLGGGKTTQQLTWKWAQGSDGAWYFVLPR